ncbi:MAG: CPBP family intramembrane glutamic endopeptidase [Actinomycetes bacterium]
MTVVQPISASPGPPEAWRSRPYPQVLRGPAHRWWRPLVGLAVVVAGIAVIFLLTAVAIGVGGLVGLVDLSAIEESFDQWWMLLATNLGIAALVPVVMLATWAGHGWRPGWTSSVVGRLRWAWLGLVAAVSTVLLVGSSLVLFLVDGWPSGGGRDVVAFLLVVALTTPLQAAGEEYLFRGWLTQAVGSLFARAAVGGVVAALVSAVLFALAHGGQDPWLFADRLAFGLLASALVWWTGGLEAAIAVHAVNNVVVFVPSVLTGSVDDALTVTAAPPSLVALDVAVMVVLGVVLVALARRRRVQRLFVPPDVRVLVPPRPLG